MDVLEKIKRLQKAHGYTVAELSKKAGIAPTTLHGLYKRGNVPTVPTLAALCGAFGITLAQFFAESDASPGLTPDQVRLLELWGAVSEAQKDIFLALLKCFLSH